jgi:hypothetical protein
MIKLFLRSRLIPFFLDRAFVRVAAIAQYLQWLFLVVVISFSISTPLAAQEVQDLRYGVVLYHYYQQSYFDALTETLVGEQRDDMTFHRDPAKLLRGGMSLSYGMGAQAETIFTELLDQLEGEKNRNRAWFYLAKLYYQRDDTERVYQVLDNINGQLDADLQQEYLFIKANLLLREGQLTAADQVAEEIDKRSPWLAYYYFNRGSSQAVIGEWQAAVNSFERIDTLAFEESDRKASDAENESVTNNTVLIDEEFDLLKDRAYIAAGYSQLGAADYSSAIDSFIKVRLESPIVNKALLGYGWSAVQQEQYQLALSPWQALSKGSLIDSSVQESLLAIPYIYEKLSSPASALQEYLRAENLFEQELVKLDAAIEAFSEGNVGDILFLDQNINTDWVANEDYLPLNDQAPYLTELIIQDHFQNVIKNVVDIARMNNFLLDASTRLSALQGILDVQQSVWEQSLNQSQRESYHQRYQQLSTLHQQLKQQQSLAEQEADGRRYVSEEEQELWDIVDHASQLVTVFDQANENIDDEREQLRLYRGLLVWEANEQAPVRSWEVQKQMRELEQLMDESREQLTVLDGLDADRYDAAFSGRIIAQQQQLELQRQLVTAALERAENEIRQLAINDLQQQHLRLSNYLGQAKLAIARLYDSASEDYAE